MAPKKKMTKNRKNEIFDFFSINKPLFVMSALEGEDIHRFVDRESLLNYFVASIDMKQKCAVIGQQGTGKSSFLLKLLDMIKDSTYTDYLQFSFPLDESEKSRLHFLRKILRSLLAVIVKNDELFKLFEEEKISFEIERLEYSIIIEDHVKTHKSVNGEIEAGIKNNLLKLLIPAEFKAKLNAKLGKEKGKVEKKDYPIHNENTLYNTIVNLLEKINDPIVLFIDELDKVGRYPLESPEWDKEVMKILELSREIMLTNKLVLVFALQNELYEKLSRAQRNEGDVSLLGLINSFKKLEGFDLTFARNAITASLTHAGYKGEIEDLFENGVIETTLSKVDGNPRLFMHYLIELSKNAFLEKHSKITMELLNSYLCEIDKG
jgi:Cdc6-like AAA superfamily ATPase